MTFRAGDSTNLSDAKITSGAQQPPEAPGKSSAARLLDEAVSITAATSESLVYSAIQSPTLGAAQFIDHVAGTRTADHVQFMSAPVEAKFGSAEWHGQQIGTGLGTAADFLVSDKLLGKVLRTGGGKGLIPGVSKALGGGIDSSIGTGLVGGVRKGLSGGFDKALGKGFGEGLEQSASRSGEPISAAALTMRSAVTGAVYQGVFSPTADSNKNFWESRTESAFSGAATFATLTGVSIGLRSAIRPSPVNAGLISRVVRSDAALGTLAGVPAGIVSAESNSLLQGHGFASSEQVVQSAYGFVVAGGPLGIYHGIKSAEVPATTGGGRASVDAGPKVRVDAANVLETHWDRIAQVGDRFDLLSINPERLDLSRDATGEISSMREETLSLSRHSSQTGEHEDVRVPSTIVTLGARKTEIVIPTSTLARYHEVRELRLSTAHFSRDERLEFSKTLSRADESTPRPPGEKSLQHDYLNRLLPEQLGPLLDELPHSDSIGRVVLFDDSGGEAAASAQGDRVNMYLFQNMDVNDARLLLFHEWSHVAKNLGKTQAFYDAAALESRDSGGYFASEYSRKNDEENMAVHLGEELLSPDADDFFALTMGAPVRTVALGEILRPYLAKAEASGKVSPYHREFVGRLNYIDTEVVPEARDAISGYLEGSIEKRLEAVKFLLKLSVENPRLCGRLMDSEQISGLGGVDDSGSPMTPEQQYQLLRAAQERLAKENYLERSRSTNPLVSAAAFDSMSLYPPSSEIGQIFFETIRENVTAGGDSAKGVLDWLWNSGRIEDVAVPNIPPYLLNDLIMRDSNLDTAAKALAIYTSPSYMSGRGMSARLSPDVLRETYYLLDHAGSLDAARIIESLGDPDQVWNRRTANKIDDIIESELRRRDPDDEVFKAAVSVAARSHARDMRGFALEVVADQTLARRVKPADLLIVIRNSFEGMSPRERTYLSGFIFQPFERHQQDWLIRELSKTKVGDDELHALDTAYTRLQP